MKSNLLTKVCLLSFMALMLVVGVSCSSDDNEEPVIVNINNQSVALNKLGLNERGDIVEVEIISNVYWAAKVVEGAEWLKPSEVGGYGAKVIQILAERNDAEERTGVINVETYSGDIRTIMVKQQGGSSAITYVREAFDEKEVEMLDIIKYGESVSWSPVGLGAAALVFKGPATTLIDKSDTSTGYEGASGGNNVLLSKVGAHVTFGAIDTKGNHEFRFEFGAKSSEATFDKSKLKLFISLNNREWTEIPYTRTNVSVWALAVADFRFEDEVSRLYYKIETTVDNVFRIDDIDLKEGIPGQGHLVDFNVVVDDGKPTGFAYMNENFAWITVGTDWIADPSAPVNTEIRFDENAPDKMPAEQRAALNASGWKTTSIYAYLRLGYMKLGKTGAGGDLVSPSLDMISEGSVVNATLTFDVSAYASAGGTKDKDGIFIEVLNEGSVGNVIDRRIALQISSWNAWRTVSFNLYGVTSETQIRFVAARMNETNRFFIDNVKVTKVVKTK